MNEQEALALLRQFNEWRRWDSDAPGPVMPHPREIGEAIDVACRVLAEHETAMNVLRQVATGDQRTRRKKLASACVRFLDAVREAAP